MKAFNRLSAGLCLSVFLFCPVHGVWGQGAGESSWQLKGLVDTYHAFRSEKPNDWMSSRTRLRGEVGKNFAGSSLFVSFNATYNALLKERTGFELREAYLDHRQEHWGFRLGRQLVIWGAADGVRITDLVSPMDMTEFLAQDYDDIRMPVNALRFFVFNDKIKLELLAVPTFEGYKLPTDAANPWSVLPKETPRSLVWDAEGSRPELRLSNVEYGGRLSFALPGVDFSLSDAAYVEQDARHRVQTIGLPTYGFAPILPHGIRRRRCLKALGTVRAARRSGLQPREAFQLHTASRLHPSKRIQHHQLVGGGRLVCPS